jgi:3-deoxy-7-phosphoheptulonate synthase
MKTKIITLSSKKETKIKTKIKVDNIEIGGDNITIIAGPCSVESREQIIDIATFIKKIGATVLRGGAFKPRTSPYSFRGLGKLALEYLLEAKKISGLPIISEIMNIKELDYMYSYVDIFQVGSRNMYNYDLLEALGSQDKPVFLKRGLSATIEEFIMAAEYILLKGNENVILCERGIRTFETSTRNTLDINCIPVLKEKTHLPIIVDPSHAVGNKNYVIPLALAAIAAGADGIMIEVHNNPDAAFSDGEQSLDYIMFEELIHKINTTFKTISI